MKLIQYMRPNGMRKEASTFRPMDVEIKAGALVDAGYWFECECLLTGEVSLTACYKNSDLEPQDIAIRVCENGPDIPKNVDELVYEAWNFAKKAGDFEP